jgi:hypothetical protein
MGRPGSQAAGGLMAAMVRSRGVRGSALRAGTVDWRYLVLAAGIVSFTLALIQAQFHDWSTYVGAVSRVQNGQPLYPAFETSGPFSFDLADQGRGFIYPPTALPLLLVLTLLGSGYLYGILASAWLIAVVMLIVRRAGYSTPAQALAAGLFLVSFPLADAVGAGQVTILIAAALGTAWLMPRSSGWLALLGLVKIYPAGLAAWGLRRRAQLVLPAIIAALVVMATTVWLGSGVWGDYIRVVINGQPTCQVMSAMSLRCATGSMIPGYLAAATALTTSIFARRYAGLALLSLAMVVAAPDFWPNYLLIPMVGFLPFALETVRQYQPTHTT